MVACNSTLLIKVLKYTVTISEEMNERRERSITKRVVMEMSHGSVRFVKLGNHIVAKSKNNSISKENGIISSKL